MSFSLLLGNDIAIAGLVLIFAGFLLTKAESYEGSRWETNLTGWQMAGLVPIITLSCHMDCIDAIKGNQWDANHALVSLQIVLALTESTPNLCGARLLP